VWRSSRIAVGIVGSDRSTAHPDRPEGNKDQGLSRRQTMLGWATTLIALCALVVSILGYRVQLKSDNEQNQQIAELQQTTPTGEITGMTAYRTSGHQPTITNLRNDPVLQQQIYSLSGVASDVPDNGTMYMVVHDYGQPTPGLEDPSNHYYVTPVTPFPTSNADQSWKDPRVYIGEKSAPKTALIFRLTIYFCDSVDAEKISEATGSTAVINYGLRSFPYPSCKQLDSIFVIRG
jgi:hypothetical protein